MRTILRFVGLALVSSIILLLSACSGGGGNGNGNGGNGTPLEPEPEDDISMTTPYVNSSDISNISSVFVGGQNRAAFMIAHSGIDFHPSGNLKPFQAVCSGEIEKVDLVQLGSTGNWQVEVIIRYNSTYSVFYAFEPMTALRADGETQLANISVSQGQAVSQGDILGYLHAAGEGNHVHFGLFKYVPNGGDPVICPEPYFTSEARDSILDLIHSDHPDWVMCY